MKESLKSSSIEQVQAEERLFALVERKLDAEFEKNPKLFLSDNAFTYIQPDFYSHKERIIGEIFSHVGKPKKAQDNKIANDILKMLLFEKVAGKKYRKIIVVCDEAELKKLRGLSALGESIRQFEIELLYIPIDPVLRDMLMRAQDRQKMANA